jgi:16S rRNA (guanine(966)-N(2))-methyltransferase RsmD
LRVIAGNARGKRLKAPSGLHTRPITDMIKEALFNVWGPDIYKAKVLDLFAGSGSVGIEAMSRGAAQTVFVDNDKNAIKTIGENLKNCGFEGGYELYHNDVFRALDILLRNGRRFDYIYVDPPFTNDSIFDQVMINLGKAELLDQEGILVIRTRKQRKLENTFGKLIKYREKNYGESTLHYYRRIEEDQNNDGDIQDFR